jgi:FKBP-type peptidyl-prolyl cis-trans isomerase FkpA
MKINPSLASIFLLLGSFAGAVHAESAMPPTSTLASGVKILITQPGKPGAPKPSATSEVKVHYRGTFENGKEFDSSYKRGEPATFPLNKVIPCWTEAVQTMLVGSKASIICPGSTAYGQRGVPGSIPPNATLHFDIELLEIIR